MVCKHYVILCLVVFLFSVECKRFSSGRSRSRPSYSHSSASRPAVYPPSSFSHPSHYAPVPAPKITRPIGFQVPKTSQTSHSAVGTPVHSSPNYGFNTKPNPTNIGWKPSVTQGTSNVGFKPSITPSAPRAEHAIKPLGSGNTASHTPVHQATNHQPSAPISSPGNTASHTPAHQATNHQPSSNSPPPYGFKPSAPIGSPVNAKPVGNTPPGAPYPIQPPPYSPHNPGVPPPANYGPSHGYNPAGYGPPPAYNYHPHYPQHGGGGVTNININNINTNTHHYGSTGGWGGYSYPSYHYSTNEVGSGALGFFLGYSLAKITTPTFYSHPTFYNGYTPRYDHYEVHHYYHNKDSVPAQSTIQPNTIVGCVGDSGAICPSGTTSLCTSNGAILCVASATSTVPCTGNTQGNCVKSIVPCVNGTGDCQAGQNTTLTIPCISKAQVPGNITYVNNTIIVNQTTIIHNANGTVIQPSANGTVPLVMGNATELNSTRSRRDVVPMNEFCVTILAVPAERKPSEQQQLLDKSTGIFSKFLVKALGIP